MTRYASLNSFLSYLGRYKLRLVVVFSVFVIADILIAIIPVFIGKLIGTLAEKPIDNDLVSFYVMALIICSSGHDIVWRLGEFLYLKLFNSLAFNYETILFQQIIQKPYPYFVDKFTGKVSSYVTTVSQELRDQLEKFFWDYADHIVRLIVVTVVLTALNWQTGLIFATGLLLMFAVGSITVRNSVKYEKVWMDTQSTKNGKIIDAIANFVNVKSFQKETDETARIDVEQTKTIKTANRSFLWGMLFWGSQGFIIRNLIWPSTIILNVYLFTHGQINLTELTAFLTAIALFSDFVWDIIWNISQFTLKLARIEEAHTYLFGSTNVIQEYYRRQSGDRQLHVLDEGLELNNLNFAYPDKVDVEVLKGINLRVEKGEKIGIVGKSGSGKTTITKLLLDYYPVLSGEIKIDGRQIPSRELAAMISYVPQDTSLFHRTIADNIAYAVDKTVTRDQIIKAAKQAHAHEFIDLIDDGYDALVGERGVKLSAGQRQRIAIARAFLDDKPILILDEATSALDSESELLVQQALEALWEDKTVLAIAHRLSTLRHMDRIIVLDKGRITEQGTHRQLIAKKGKYAELWAHQSGGFLED